MEVAHVTQLCSTYTIGPTLYNGASKDTILKKNAGHVSHPLKFKEIQTQPSIHEQCRIPYRIQILYGLKVNPVTFDCYPWKYLQGYGVMYVGMKVKNGRAQEL